MVEPGRIAMAADTGSGEPQLSGVFETPGGQAVALPQAEHLLSRLLRRRAAVAALLALTAIVLLSVLGPLVLTSPTELSGDRLASPSLEHWFGTDEIGRDLFSRVSQGGRVSLGIAAGATLLAILVGALWGLTAAMVGGFLDELLMRFGDVVMALPQLLLGLVFVAAFGASGTGLAVIVGLLLTPTTARIARAAALAELKSDYYLAAVAYGASRPRLIRSEVLPNALAPLTVQASINFANAIILEAALSFVGLGIQPPAASWGTLLQEGYKRVYQTSGYIIFPGIATFLTIWMLNIFADQLNQALDPRRRAR